jgi:hypothetical protein
LHFSSRNLTRPSQRRDSAPSEYVVLIERKGRYDHLSAIADILTNYLAAKGVRISRYYFSDDPRVIRDDSMHEKEMLLEELASFSRSLPILIFATPADFVNQLSRKPIPQVIEAFSEWNQRVLLNFVPVEGWADREENLLQSGFSITSASTQGVIALASKSMARLQTVPAIM